MLKKNASLFLFTCLLASCQIGPSYRGPPCLELPHEWKSAPEETLNQNSSDSFVWWEAFQDPVLCSLIECAASQNLDLHIALTRILEARMMANARKAETYPRIDFSSNYDHVYYSKDALINGLLGTALPVNSQSVQRNVNFFEAGFDAEWEIDLFGVSSHDLKALKAQQEVAEQQFCDVWISLSAEIAKHYIQLRSLQQEQLLMEKRMEAQKNGLLLTKELAVRGIMSEIETRQSWLQFHSLAADKPSIEAHIQQEMHALCALLNYLPGELDLLLLPPSPLPQLPCDHPIGVPSELLRRRPDIRKSERELAAATEKIGSAVASLFPRFSLRGFVGEISTNLGSLFSPASFTWLGGPQMLIPIFNSRLIVEDIKQNRILTQRAVYQYQKTVIGALEETENAIAAYHAELQRAHQLEEAFSASQEALRMAHELYQLGIFDQFTLLKAKERAFLAEEIYLKSQTDLLLDYVSLYKALGGSWKEEL